MSNDTELLHASVIKRIWKKCKEEDMDIVAFAWRIQREAERAAVEASARQLSEQPGFVMVPVEFVRGFHALAHNYSLRAEPPDHYRGTEGDAFSNAYRRCGSDLAELKGLLTASPTAPTEASEPVGFMSEKQLAAIKDPEDEHGHYIPMRKTPAGNFTLPLYTTPPPAPVLSDAEIDAITLAQWGDRVLLAAYRAYARAIEQAIGRASRGAK